MSINLTVTIPIATVEAVTKGTDPHKTADAITTITKAVIESAEALPYSLVQKEEDDEDAQSILSFDSDEPAFTNTRARALQTAAGACSAEPKVQVFVKTLTGKTVTFDVRLSERMPT